MRKARINLNGDTWTTLYTRQSQRLSALKILMEAHNACFPHGRNYQHEAMFGADYQKDRAEAERIMEILKDLQDTWYDEMAQFLEKNPRPDRSDR